MKSFPSARGFIPGLIVLTLGVLFLLHNFDVLRLWDLWLYWPLILIAAGVHRALDSQSRALGIGAICLGIGFQAVNLEALRFHDLLDFWPFILITVGITLLARKKVRQEAGWVPGTIVLLLGVIFQFQELDWFNVSIQRLWPVLLITAGLGLLHKALRSRQASD